MSAGTCTSSSVKPKCGAIRPRSWPELLPEPSVRTAEELRDVLASPDCACKGPAYYMYRDVARSAGDRAWMKSRKIRFDITVIPPRTLCGEYIKTKGHYHPDDPSGTGYPEIYEVLAGEAHYLIQTSDCSDIVLIAARAGDVVVVPSGYGHVTINPSKRSMLEMANIVSSAFVSDYRGYESMHGAAYYEMETGGLIKNNAYPQHTNLRIVQARRITEISDTLTDPLYQLIQNRAPVLDFLNYPEKYETLFCDLYP
ncbi:MAG TPA: glucose-6-phosphate isomerase family protein [Methanoregula sp.]|nr:glucose-6-phosphate isomerase family protein [Methanoregula sp.]